MKRPKKVGAPKAVSYVLILASSDIGGPMYERLYQCVADHHGDLDRTNVRVALAWATSWKPDVDGRLTLGKCKKASDLDRELAPYDFCILLNQEFWLNPRVTDAQRQALLDHELMHAAVVYDEDGEIKHDERGRACYRIRKHDIEEFADIVARHGCYKRDLEEFARAIVRAEHATGTAWVGYTRVHEALKAVRLDVPVPVIATWDEDDRREVLAWALLRYEAGGLAANVTLSQTMPPCLAAVVNVPAPVIHATH